MPVPWAIFGPADDEESRFMATTVGKREAGLSGEEMKQPKNNDAGKDTRRPRRYVVRMDEQIHFGNRKESTNQHGRAIGDLATSVQPREPR